MWLERFFSESLKSSVCNKYLYILPIVILNIIFQIHLIYFIIIINNYIRWDKNQWTVNNLSLSIYLHLIHNSIRKDHFKIYNIIKIFFISSMIKFRKRSSFYIPLGICKSCIFSFFCNCNTCQYNKELTYLNKSVHVFLFFYFSRCPF